MTADPDLTPRLTAALPHVLRVSAAKDGPMAGLIAAQAALLAPRAAMIDRGAALFDPLSAPEALLPYLASWLGHGPLFRDPADPRRMLDLARGFPPGADRLRQFLAAWPALHRARAGAEGLRMTLMIATGASDFAVHEDEDLRHLEVRAPAALAAMAPFLSRLIARERPAHLTWRLTFAPEEAL